MSPSEYRIIFEQMDGTFAVTHEHFGELADGFEFSSSAEDFITDHIAEREQKAQDEAIANLEAAVADFLHDLDRHELARHFLIGAPDDRAEIASLTSLRAALVASERRAA